VLNKQGSSLIVVLLQIELKFYPDYFKGKFF